MGVSPDDRPGLRPADVVATSGATLACAVVVLSGRWVPGWERSALTFGLLAAAVPLLRWLAMRFPRVRAFDAAASMWMGLAAPLGHTQLGPVVDAVSTHLHDRDLALWDLRVFGGHPSVWAGHALPGWAMDVLLLCYYTYFVWPAVLAIALYRRPDRTAFDRYALAMSICLTTNFILYALVPAVGPRFYLASLFDRPLGGTYVAPYLESLMRTPAFLRDCFPSGHTAATVLGLGFAWRYARRVFWPMLPVGVGLIVATVAGRFHYGVDCLCAIPLAAFCAAVGAAIVRGARAPEPERRPVPAWRWIT
ncbi:MAG TPA: phosphatase PAP2 family protein [Myxococcaceae bacterium]|nr:phosphatase PAP2 family protein [Myxococcaceae bacterium]